MRFLRATGRMNRQSKDCFGKNLPLIWSSKPTCANHAWVWQQFLLTRIVSETDSENADHPRD